jgi:hypothetical protein
MRKTGFAIAGVAAALALAAPAQAINDGRVPADECSGDNPNVVGTPGGEPNPGLANTDQLAPAASANNPGRSTGARGEERSQAPCNE